MKLFIATLLCSTLSYASLDTINSFKADFTQSVTDDKNATLQYSGNLSAQKPQNAVWHYLLPIQKDVYIDRFRVSIVEPEIEQVIIRRIQTKFDFFHMIKNAKKIDANRYEAYYEESKFIIDMQNKLIKKISYQDTFENTVIIVFTNQEQNVKMNEDIFTAVYPLDYDVIRD
ncbi:MAG: LolA-like outer membrane lipoprotein chaperone [Sulfurimonas sp.]|nr:LolA-like outer membrane lipoprotein chaperone [Sulfurimonas sp.]MDQ7061894.1 LolA-like outer membrane lipoprotein chaperone [Sulfurimonas sp.]